MNELLKSAKLPKLNQEFCNLHDLGTGLTGVGRKEESHKDGKAGMGGHAL